MAGNTLSGQSVQAVRDIVHLNLGAFTANTTVTPAPRFGVPLGSGRVRIVGIHVTGSAIPSDADGTLLLNALVNDVSEGADDTLVASQDLETLVTAANRYFECTLAADGSENIRTLEEGDTLRFTLVSDSAAIDANPNLNVAVEYVPVPEFESVDLTRPVLNLTQIQRDL